MQSLNFDTICTFIKQKGLLKVQHCCEYSRWISDHIHNGNKWIVLDVCVDRYTIWRNTKNILFLEWCSPNGTCPATGSLHLSIHISRKVQYTSVTALPRSPILWQFERSFVTTSIIKNSPKITFDHKNWHTLLIKSLFTHLCHHFTNMQSKVQQN